MREIANCSIKKPYADGHLIGHPDNFFFLSECMRYRVDYIPGSTDNKPVQYQFTIYWII